MYRAFNLNWNEEVFNQIVKPYCQKEPYIAHQSYLRNDYDTQKCVYGESLEDYLFSAEDQRLDGDILQKKWFPIQAADVFISHSHKDIDMVLKLKYLLENLFGLSVFVDSLIWGNVNDLLRQMDQKYCRLRSGSYDYAKRNNTTANAHIILAEALTQMMNQCECVFFLNTGNSTLYEGYGNQTQVASPWIYHELLMTKYLKQQPPKQSILESKMRPRALDSKDVIYTVELSHLIPLSLSNFNKWISHCGEYSEKNLHPLDALYQQLADKA